MLICWIRKKSIEKFTDLHSISGLILSSSRIVAPSRLKLLGSEVESRVPQWWQIISLWLKARKNSLPKPLFNIRVQFLGYSFTVKSSESQLGWFPPGSILPRESSPNLKAQGKSSPISKTWITLTIMPRFKLLTEASIPKLIPRLRMLTIEVQESENTRVVKSITHLQGLLLQPLEFTTQMGLDIWAREDYRVHPNRWQLLVPMFSQVTRREWLLPKIKSQPWAIMQSL